MLLLRWIDKDREGGPDVDVEEPVKDRLECQAGMGRVPELGKYAA